MCLQWTNNNGSIKKHVELQCFGYMCKFILSIKVFIYIYIQIYTARISVDRWDSVARCRHPFFHGLSLKTAGREGSPVWSESSNGKSTEEVSAKPKTHQWWNMCIILLCFVQDCENCVYSFCALYLQVALFV